MRFRKPAVGAKGRPACGVSTAGFVMADEPARLTLASGQLPEFWSAEVFEIVIAEGEPDFWSWATEPARTGMGESATSFPVVLGVVGGSFDRSIAHALPYGTRITSAMHRDPGGDRLNDRIARVLADADNGFTLSRWGRS
jgi:hypothetical protein